ncbi:hypothetical protein FACS1894137_12440 [Spirochaetia bacterium]|nr:hypothetical protein FACS1894137_12440 [Spirochaetia bacterium]
MKKKFVLTGVFALLCIAALSAQSIDAKVEAAIAELVSQHNRLIEVVISPVTIADTNTPTEFSQVLGDKINLFAAKHPLYQVVRAAPRGRGTAPAGGTEKGKIEGTYRKMGNSVEVTLFLVSDTGVTINPAAFKIPIKELEDLEIAILPANAQTEKEVREQEKIFAPLAAPPSSGAKSIAIEAWPNHENRIYYAGDTISINLIADRDCYFKVFHIDTNNMHRRLFPNQYEKGAEVNFLKANTLKTIPGENSSLEITDDTLGQETFYIVASTAPLDLPDSELEETKASADLIAKTQKARGVKAAALRGAVYFTFTTLGN